MLQLILYSICILLVGLAMVPSEDQSKKTPMKDLMNLVHTMEQTAQQIPPMKGQPKKKKDPLLQSHNFDQGPSDADIIENPPAWTGYNSLEGYKIYNGNKYYHGDVDPYGNKVNAPKLTDAEWAEAFESYDKKEYYFDEVSNVLKFRRFKQPTRLHSIDLRMMDLLNSSDRLIILATRGYHKSVNIQRKALRSILDQQMNVVYYSATIGSATDFTNNIRTQLKFNPKILRAYGYIINEKQGDRQDKMFFVWQPETTGRDAGLAAGSVEGGSKTGTHPDLIIVDDVCDTDSKSEKKQINMREWYSKQVEGMIMGNCIVLMVGTPKDKKDLYAQLESTDMYIVERLIGILEWPNHGQKQPAQPNDIFQWSYTYHQGKKDKKPLVKGVKNIQGGKVLFDGYMENQWTYAGRVLYYIDDEFSKGIDRNRMAMQEFLLKKKIMGDIAFEAEVQMNPIVMSQGQFDFSRLHYFDFENEPNRHLLLNAVAAFFDQSFGFKETADWNVISVVGYYDEQWYILDMVKWQNQFDAILEKESMIQLVYKKWPTITIFGMEMDAANAEDSITIMNHLELSDIPFMKVRQQDYFSTTDETEDVIRSTNMELDPSLNVKKSKVTKFKRIYNQWYARLMERKIWWNQRIAAEVLEWFMEEWGFPDPYAHVDGLDCVGSACDLSMKAGDEMMFVEGGYI